MTTKIYLTNYGYLDLYDEVSVPINYSLATIQDVSKRNAAFSKTIVLPGTNNNSQLLGKLFEVNLNFIDSDFLINKKVAATIFQNDVPVLKGWFKLLKVVKTSPSDISFDQNIDFEAIIFEDQVSLYDIIKDKNLTDIDLSPFDHTLDFTNIMGTSAHTWVDVYKYPFHYTTDNFYDFKDFRPAIFVKYLWDRIFADAGFTYTSTFLNSDPFTKLLLPYTGKELTITDTDKESREFRVSFNIGFTQTFNALQPYNNYFQVLPINITQQYIWTPTLQVDTPIPQPYNNDTFGVNFDGSLNQYDTTNGEMICRRSGEYILENSYAGQITLINSGPDELQWFNTQPLPQPQPGSVVTYTYLETFRGFPPPRVEVTTYYQVLRGGTFPSEWHTSSTIIDLPININTGTTVLSYTATTPQIQIQLNGTDIVRSRVRLMFLETSLIYDNFVNYVGVNPLLQIGMTITGYDPNTNYFRCEALKNQLQYRDRIILNQIIPQNIKQFEFVSSIVKMFNLYIQQDPDNPSNVFIKPRDEFYSDFQNDIVDWTNKFDYNQQYSIDFLSELQNRTLNFNWKDGKDVVNGQYKVRTNFNYGQYKVNFDNDFLTGEKLISAMFEPTPLVENLKDIAYDNVYNKPMVVPYLVPNTESNPKILYDGGFIQTTSFDALAVTTGGTSVFISLPGYIYCGHFDDPNNPSFDLNWNINQFYFYTPSNTGITNNNLYNLYWFNYISLISQSKLLTGYFHLNQVDIANLNFAKPIWIRDSYWLLNKIVDYNSTQNDGLTRVELIKSIAVPKFQKNKKTIVSPVFVGPQIKKTISNDYNDYMVSPNVGNTNYGDQVGVIGKDNMVNYLVINGDISGNNNYVSPDCVNVTIVGSGNTVNGQCSNIVIRGNNNTLQNGCQNISIVNGNNNFVKSTVTYVSINNTNDQIVYNSNTGYINEWVYYYNGIYINNSDIVDGGVDVIYQPLPGYFAENVVDSGLNNILDTGVVGAEYLEGNVDGIYYNLQFNNILN
jgi:hypothetical protein